MVRQASFKGLREDKRAKEVLRERAGAAPRKSRRQTAAQLEETGNIAGVRLTHPEKVLYPDHGLTKRDLALYYGAIAERILPHLEDRPLSLLRCPEGHHKECFFQKHAYAGIDASIKKVRIREKSGTGIYLTVDSPRGLVSLAQSGVLELHTWGARVDQLESPDRMIFDLDPDPAVLWPRVVKLAHVLHERLAALGLRAFVKTTGGKGLHIVVPIKRTSDWKQVVHFSGAIANSFVRDDPTLYIATMSKAKRTGKIFIDHFRNRRGATAVAAYSTRARAGAPVSTPITWDELTARLKSDHFTVWNLPARLAKLRRDPWEGYDAARRSLTASMLRKLEGM